MNRFRGFLVPRPDWIKVLCLFGTLGLHRLLTKTLKFSQNFKNFKNLNIFNKFQNSKIKNKNLKFSQNFKISKISKFKKKSKCS